MRRVTIFLTDIEKNAFIRLEDKNTEMSSYINNGVHRYYSNTHTFYK